MKSNRKLTTSYVLAGISFAFILVMIGAMYVYNQFDFSKGVEVDTNVEPSVDTSIKISSDSIADTSYKYKFKNGNDINLKVKKID